MSMSSAPDEAREAWKARAEKAEAIVAYVDGYLHEAMEHGDPTLGEALAAALLSVKEMDDDD